MHQKLTIIFLVAALLTGCGAQNSESIADNMAGYAIEYDEKDTVAEAYSYEEECPEDSLRVVDVPIEGQIEEDAGRCVILQFHPMTNTIVADDGTTLLYESYCEAEFTAQDPETDAWVNSKLEKIQNNYRHDSLELLEKAREHYREYKDTFYAYSNYLNMGIARHDDRIMSILTTNSVYSGGAHPITLQSSVNLDTKNRKCLKLEDIIEKSAVDKMHQLVLSVLKEDFCNLGGGILYDDYLDTIQNSMIYGNLTQYWYLNHDGLVIYYNQYEIAPYAAGIIKIEIPYSDLEGILKEEYFPEEYEENSGDLVLIGEETGSRKIPVQIGEGSSFTVGVEGTVYQLQLSEITWLDNTPISKRMLLSMDEMHQGDVIEIVGQPKDDDQSISIEFQNGMDKSKVYYIHENELSEKP